MQQTEKYKLNLIEPSDPFLPEGLNANTQKMEDVMAAHEALVDGRVDGLDQRVTVLEGFCFASGLITSNLMELPFTPVAVLTHSSVSSMSALSVTDREHDEVKLLDHGFQLTGVQAGNLYMAFGYL